ncbi:MAG: carbohydrate porin [Verrucomicrobiaceae bacterium]|nr:carbohydrate porin [Verrucomicrobiaceae bacterium]
MKKFVYSILLWSVFFTTFAERRNYFIENTFDEVTEEPITHGTAYRNEIGTRTYPWNLTFQEWFNSPYLMPMRRYLLEDKGIVPTISYLGNFAANTSGGRSQGSAMASNVNIDLGIDFGKLTQSKLLEGLTFGNTWSWRFGNNLSREKIGNNFTVQQVYGDAVLRCQAMYFGYHTQIDDDWKLHLKLGRIAAADNFLSKPIYWLYQNNAFDGNPVGIFKQQKWSAYPTAAWGAFARIEHIDGQYFKAGVYQINSDKQNSPHEHGFDWSFDGDGVNANFELGWDINHDDSGKSPANISIGLAADWYNVPYLSRNAYTDFSYTIYLQADYMVWNLGNPKRQYDKRSYIPRTHDSYRDLRGLILWGAIEFNPNSNTAEMPLFINGGILFNAPFKERADDVLCFGVAYGKFSDNLPINDYRRDSYEMLLELNYKFQVNRFFFLQPNIQYIINTNGGEYPNAVVLGLQFGLNL